MARDYSGGSPKHHHIESKKKRLTWIFGVSALCIVCYMLGAWQTTSAPVNQSELYQRVGCDETPSQSGNKTSSSVSSSSSSLHLDFESHHQVDINKTEAVQKFPPCDMSYSEYTPCQDATRGRKFDRSMLKYRERHCPTKEEQLLCLIPAPPKYKTPFKWPQSRDFAWYDNIPHRELSIEKAVQNWIQVEGERFRFPGGGTGFPRGADAYIDEMNALIPLTKGNIRTAIDTGCGVASWGAYLLKRDILTMSFAPRDTHAAQVQFALERGVPAMIGVMASKRLPYPARAFDMAHCSRCLIPWMNYDGMYLIEVDRVLRPGGYWILSGPPINWKTHWRGWERTQEDLKQEQDSIESVAKRLCWKKVIEKNDLAIWQKPINHVECVKSRNVYKTPHICKSDNPDMAWERDMESCITPLPETSDPNDVAGGALEKWPERAFAVPPRISSGSIPGITAEKLREDNQLWKERVVHYKRIVPISKGRYRNVMDMNAYLGGFAAALSKYPVWVMNTVPANSNQDTLGVIYERGFLGTYQDWCEPFSTYPRTYDLIHAGGIFSIYQDRCDITLILLEMDRILRPEGTVVFRDTVEILVKIKAITDGMRWKSQIMDHESGPFNPWLLDTNTFQPNPDYYSALLWHRLMGNKALSTSFSGTKKIRAYAHCSKKTKGITVLLINLDSNTTVQVRVSTDSTGRPVSSESLQSSKDSDDAREEYHLTAQDGDLQSKVMLLNGKALSVDSSGDIPPLEPITVRLSDPTTVAPFSIVFVHIPNTTVPACA